MKVLAPVVLFAYNRLKHLKLTIKALQENDMAEKSVLFVFSDGPKGDKDEYKVKAVREFLNKINGFKEKYIVNRERNLGLADNIIDGVTRVIGEYGRAIILEDDLVTSPFFLRFMNEALERYEGEEKVMHISGYMFPIKKEGLPDTFFLKLASCWGWATWKRAWQSIEINPHKWIDYFTEEERRDINLNDTMDYWNQLKLNYEGKIKTWAIFWYLSVYAKGGLSLNPRDSLTNNIGFDESGVHCGDTRFYDTELSLSSNWDFPCKVEEHPLARARLEEYFAKIKNRRSTALMGEGFYFDLKRILKRTLFRKIDQFLS